VIHKSLRRFLSVTLMTYSPSTHYGFLGAILMRILDYLQPSL
jgi:hypothetical protein